MSKIGERLAQEVERIGGVTMTAQALEVARNTLYNWMEKENIPVNKLLELGRLGADVSFILSGARTLPPLPSEPTPEDPLARRKAMVKMMVDQISDEKGLDEIQVEIEKIEQIRELKREVAELRQKTG